MLKDTKPWADSTSAMLEMEDSATGLTETSDEHNFYIQQPS